MKSKEEVKRNVTTSSGDAPSGDALGGHGSISEWEKYHGHGFWGSSANGYITDEEEKKMR